MKTFCKLKGIEVYDEYMYVSKEKNKTAKLTLQSSIIRHTCDSEHKMNIQISNQKYERGGGGWIRAHGDRR